MYCQEWHGGQSRALRAERKLDTVELQTASDMLVAACYEDKKVNEVVECSSGYFKML